MYIYLQKQEERVGISNMIDGNNRNIDYIRISLTDRCNMRCIYCMPENGVESVTHDDILSFEEIIHLAKIFAASGIRKVKLTGGEPLIRKGVIHLVTELKKIPGIQDVTITTNGMLLSEMMHGLVKAGIDGINISLDTLNPQVFETITRKNSFDKVWEGLQTALQYPQIPLKINCVPMGIENQNVLELAQLARKYPVHVRYIEMMPIGFGKQFTFCSEESLLEELQKRYGEYVPYEKTLGNGPGHYYEFSGFKGKIGFISAISHKFCASCNRVRLTSQGYLKTCLQYDIGTDLRALLREGASDERLGKAIEDAIRRKPMGHQFHQYVAEHEEELIMSQIGG